MKQKTILVTGSTSGIGRTIALTFAKEWHVILLGRGIDKLEDLALEIRSTGGICTFYSMDLSLPQSIASVAQTIVQSHPALDWLVNNAGVIEPKSNALDLSLETFSHVLQVNLVAPYHLTQALWPSLKKGDGGVVNISSTAGLHGNPDFPAYSASKSGLISLSESLARNTLFQDNKKYVVNLIPGATNTPMRQQVAKDANQQQSTQAIADWLNKVLKNKGELSQIHGKRVIIKNNQIIIE